MGGVASQWEGCSILREKILGGTIGLQRQDSRSCGFFHMTRFLPSSRQPVFQFLDLMRLALEHCSIAQDLQGGGHRRQLCKRGQAYWGCRGCDQAQLGTIPRLAQVQHASSVSPCPQSKCTDAC